MDDTSLIKLVNPEFTIEFMGKSYQLRKATLDKAVMYQQKVKALDNDEAYSAKIVAYCLYIMLKSQIPDLNEEMVLANTPADVDVIEMLSKLGFINPINLQMAEAARKKILSKLDTEKSSSS